MKTTALLRLGAVLILAGSAVASLSSAASLTARSALLRAMEANFDLQIEDLSPDITLAEIAVEESAFLPMVFAEARYDDSFSMQNSIDFAALQQRFFDEQNLKLRSGVGGRLPWGTTYELSTEVREIDNSLNRQGLPTALFSPEYDAFTGLNLRQPLLKGFGKAANLSGVRAARSQLVITERTREVAVNNKCVQVLNAFYDLAYAEENVRVKANAVGVAEQFLRETERRRELGMLSPVDVSEAQVRRSEAQEELIQARDFLRERQLEMVGLLSLPTGDNGTTDLPTVTADLLEHAPELSMAEFFPGALDARPDYLLAAERVNQAGVRTAAARNERLPQLDLHFSYGLHGLGADYSSAYDRTWTGDEPQWGAGLSLSVPISRREGKAKVQAAKVYERQAELRVEQLRQRISLEVENAVRRLDVLDQRLATARSSVNFAAEGLKLEEARLGKGQTSGFAVSEMQRRLADAQTRELAARVDLTKAVTELWSVSGQLLTRYQIEVLREAPESNGINWMAPFDAMMKK